MKISRDPGDVHAPLGAYTHQIELTGPARWLVLSGQVGRRTDGSVPRDTLEQLEVALANVERNLGAAGMNVTDVVKLTLYLVGDVDVHGRRAVLGAWLRDHRPCMTVVFVSALAESALRVEVEALSVRLQPASAATARRTTGSYLDRAAVQPPAAHPEGRAPQGSTDR